MNDSGVLAASALRATDSAPPAATGTPAIGRPVLQAAGVDKVYGNGVVALRGTDLTVREGEFVSLLGPSGCGKSTLLRILAGLGEPSGGRLHWWEQSFDAVGDRGRRLAFVFQEATLMPWARVRANVRLPLDLARMPRAEAETKVDEVLSLVGLDDFDRAYPRELSGGMQMRVSIARAMVTGPDLLFMDEPFGALDEMTRNRLNDEVLNLWRSRGWTVVFVTHSVYEAVYLSTRVVVMAARPGRIIADIPIDAGYPRGNAFRHSPAYADACRRVSTALESASQAGAGDGT